MNETMNDVIQFIKEDMEATDHLGFVVRLNEDNITLSYSSRNWKEIATFPIKEGMDLSTFIQKFSLKIIKDIPASNPFVSIETYSFDGYDSVIDKGPIKLYGATDNGHHFSINFSSKDEKNRKMLFDFIQFIEKKRGEDSSDEFMKLRDFLYGIEEGDYSLALEDNTSKGPVK